MVERSSLALVCVMALAGLVSAVGIAGCSSDAEPAAPVADADAGGLSDGGTTTPGDAAKPNTCPSTPTIDFSELPFKSPRVIPGACADDDLAFFFARVGATARLPEIEKQMKLRNAECAACIFGAADDDTWAPIIATADGEYMENVGGCFAVVSGNDACGKAYQATNRCVRTTCAACSESEAGGCSEEVRDEGGACAEPFTEFLVECGPDPSAITRTCVLERTYLVEGSIVRQCGGAKPDGGE